MNLNTLILTKNLAYSEYRWITPKGVFWHSTGASNPNLSRYVGPDDGKLGKNQYGNHWNRSYADMGRKICPQFAIGKLKDGSIATYQLLPDDGKRFMRGHHSGVGNKGNGNDSYVGFEILEDSTNNKDYAMAVYREAIELTAYLCQRFNLDPLGKNVIVDHAEGYRLGIASNHGDVLHWFGKYGITLQKIRNDVAAEMKVKPPTNPKLEAWTAKTTLKQGTKGKHVEVIQAILMAGGYDVREIDGDYGAVTVNAVKKYQKDHKQVDDGWIGAQTWGVILGQKAAEQPKPEPPVFKPYSVKVTTPNGLNVRKEPTTSAARVTVIGLGAIVQITEVKGDWGYTAKYGGWIHLGYTQKA